MSSLAADATSETRSQGEVGAPGEPRGRAHWLGAAGIGYPILVIVGDDVIATNGEPPGLNATTAEVARYLAEQPGETAQWLGHLLAVGGVGLLALFFGRLYATLRVSRSAWLPELALGAGLAAVAIWFAAYAPFAAVAYADDAQFEPETARLAYALGGALFLLPWAPAAVALYAAAAVVLSDNVLPRWFGWVTLAQATAFVVGLAAYAVGEWAFLAYVLFWLWLVAAAVALVRRPA
jgi:hypothetical protein